MNTQTSRKRSIPQRLAMFLFFGGSVFALPCFLFFLAALSSAAWSGCVFLLCGFLVYIGWFWRAWHTPSGYYVITLWLLSFVQNSFPWLFILQSEHWHLPALHGFYSNGIPGFGFIIFGWWLVASVLSIVAFVCEYSLQRPMQKTH
jgi:hypothetical protein